MELKLESIAIQLQKLQLGMKMEVLNSDLVLIQILETPGKKNGADKTLIDIYFASKELISKCVEHEIVRLNYRIILT
jgi:hypothetical protein